MTVRSLAACLLTCFVCTAVAAAEPPGEWHDDYAAALAEARATGRPLLVHFHAAWCGPCRRMEKTVLNEAEVLDALRTRIVGVKLDVDDHGELAEQFGVSGFPSDVFVSPSGAVVSSTSGYTRLAGYLARIDRATRQFETKVSAASTN